MTDPGDGALVGRCDPRIEALSRENARLMQAIAARDSFLAVAAHELRNPMTPILGRVTLLRRAVERGDTANETIVQGLERIERLVTHFIKRATTLLDVARADADSMPVDRHPVDVGRLALDVADDHRPSVHHAGATLDVSLPSHGPVLALGDRLALEQVVENLLTNAIKYGAGAPIRVSVSTDPERGRASLVVQDEGPGIPAEHQARIFERYERAPQPQSRVEGFGVGLWIVRKLCEAMDGTVDVVSQPGRGAMFRVSLPLARVEEAT